MVGRTISHYQILAKLGEGGRGVVYKALDLRLNRPVALKFILPRLLDSDETLQCFLREARAVSALNHPNVATIHEIGEEDGQRFLVLEYLAGGNLEIRIRNTRLSGSRFAVHDVIRCGLQVAEGLAHAHRHGIVHCDVKPANIMCTEEHVVKVTDFGLAKCLSGREEHRSSRSLAGTLLYMSPEQVQGLDVDHRTDIYSLGVTLYEMATGERPFSGADAPAIMHAVLHAPIPSLKHSCPEAPDALDELVRRAMAKNPADRYQKTDKLVRDLRRIITKLESVVKSATFAASDVSTESITTSARGRLSRVRLGVISGVVSLALLTLGVSPRVWSSRCLWTPGLFSACGLPAEKHVGVLPLRSFDGRETRDVFLLGLRGLLTAKARQLARYQESLCVHNVESPDTASGVGLLFDLRTERAGDSVRLSGTLSNPAGMLPLRRFQMEADLRQVSSLQDGLPEKFAVLLGFKVSSEATIAMSSGGTAIRDAFESCLRGLGQLERGGLDAAIQSLQKACDLDPFYAPAHAGLGEAYRRKHGLGGDPHWLDEAVKECNQAIQLNDRQASAYESLGLISIGQLRYDSAIKYLTRAVEIDPLSIELRAGLATAYGATNLEDHAESVYRQAVQLRPGCWLNYRHLGKFYMDRGLLKRAKEAFQEAAARAPKSYREYNNLGALCYKAERYDEAIRFFEQSLELKPAGAIYSNLGTLYFHMGCYADAAQQMEKATALGESNYLILGNLAEAYLLVPQLAHRAAGAFKKAISLANEELVRKPNDPELLWSVATFHARLGEKGEALDTISRALRVAPDNVDCHFRAALVYEMTGKRKLALEELGDALRRGYSVKEVCGVPQLKDLRNDPGFQLIVKGVVQGGCDSANGGGKLTGAEQPGACPSGKAQG